MIAVADLGTAPLLHEATSAFELITSNDWEGIWWQDGFSQSEQHKNNAREAKR